VNAETEEHSKQWMHTHSPNKSEKFKQTFTASQKVDRNGFLGQETNADSGIHATRDHSNVRSLLRNTKLLRRTIQNKMCGMLTSGVVLLHDNTCPHTDYSPNSSHIKNNLSHRTSWLSL
jgi:hypothetical protein